MHDKTNKQNHHHPMKKKELTYKEAVNEIELILQKIESEELDVDELTEKVKRAAYLMKWCKEKLRSSEKEIETVLKDLNQDEAS
jgi:exodeoxyribonuclease VII small subunit